MVPVPAYSAIDEVNFTSFDTRSGVAAGLNLADESDIRRQTSEKNIQREVRSTD